jgi:hypothetical protein
MRRVYSLQFTVFSLGRRVRRGNGEEGNFTAEDTENTEIRIGQRENPVWGYFFAAMNVGAEAPNP